MATIGKASVDCVTKRQSRMQRNEPIRKDMLSKAFAIYEADLDNEKKTPRHKMMEEDLSVEALAALGAGSETTAIALRAILYKLITHPSALQRLRDELTTAEREGRLSRPYIRYAETQKLPYLIACCKEGMRLHPSIALTFPREIPSSGLKIGSTYLAPGYKAGINPAVLHYNRDVFGEDADAFRPERWLGEGKEQMERCMFGFGAGKRACMGINVGDGRSPSNRTWA